MNKPAASLVAALTLAATPALASAAAPVLAPSSAQTAMAAAVYPLPAPRTPAAAAHAGATAAAGYLAQQTAPGLAAKSSFALGATASGPGTFTFQIATKLKGKTLVLAKGSKKVSRGGALSVKLTITKAGKAALAHAAGKLKLSVTATFKPKHGKAKTAKSTATLK